MPPQASGIADYSARLLEEIVDYVDVDVFVAEPVSEYESPGSEGLTLRRHEAFPLLDAAGAYDEVIYCMGNSEFHGYIYDSLIRRPGVILAHEVRFSGFYSWYSANRSPDTSFFERSLAVQHPNTPAELGARGWITIDEAERFGIYMVSELVERSKRFLVHSRYAADIAELSSGLAERVSVVPFGIPDPVEKVSAGSPYPLIVTIGIAAEVKKTETFVGSIPTVLESLPNARFVIVGGFAPPEFQERIEDLAMSLGVSDRLSITGHVERGEYETWLRRATCAVQLRATSNGETSAAVGDCLRHGIPTIVTEIGPAREYPPGTVIPIALEASPRQLGEMIVRIAQNPGLETSLSQAGIDFVRSSTFAGAARSIIERVDLLVPGRNSAL
jgi:glycosyltransferase involved in cell wall biosynthesis